MQLSQSMLKLVIKMLLFLIFITVVYLIIVLLFSARYWPDVYNYINANITIKRIPTINELNLTIIEVVEREYTTEIYTTEIDTSTVGEYEIDANDFKNLFDIEAGTRKKKQIEIEDVKDYSELSNGNVVIDYVFDNGETTIKDLIREDNEKLEDATKVIKDLIDESELAMSNSKDVEMVTGVFGKLQFGSLNYFVDDKNETLENIPLSNIPKDFLQIQDVTFSEVDKILTDVSNLLKIDLESKFKPSNTVFRNVNNETQIFVKRFDLDKENVKNYIQNKVNTDAAIDDLIKHNLASNKNLNKSKTADDIKANEKIKLNNVLKEGIENVRDNEISDSDVLDDMYYDSREDNSTDYPIIDYVELYKDTTNEDTYIRTEIPTSTEVNLRDEIQKKSIEIEGILEHSMKLINNGSNDVNLENGCHGNASSTMISDTVYPWIASIFIKNDTQNEQFDYYCDGALLSNRAVITAAKCVFSSKTLDPNDLLVILGKRSLKAMAESEKVYKIKQIITHENFTIENGVTTNDLAILVVEDAVMFSQTIQKACLNEASEDHTSAATVAWDFTGNLKPVYFDMKKSESCDIDNTNENTFCATYGDAVALCPNYGGIYVTKQANDHWCLQGIRTGDPTVRGICFNKTVYYTSLNNYLEWITDIIRFIKSE